MPDRIRWGNGKCPLMTFCEDEMMDPCDGRKKVSDNPSTSCPKAWGMMAT